MGESYNKGTHCLKGGFETFPCYIFLIPHFAFEFDALLHAETECPRRLLEFIRTVFTFKKNKQYFVHNE